jgi:hypothetical protein
MRTNFLQLERSFFDHPKVDLLIEKHGINGAYCLLFIWSEMMHRDGIFDSTNDYDIVACARKSRTTVEQVLAIIQTSVKISLLTPVEKKKGFYQKDRIDEALESLNSVSKSRSDAGKASAESKRQKKLNSTNVKQVDNISVTSEQQSLNNSQLLTNKLTNKVSTSTEGSRSTTSESSNGLANSDSPTGLWARLSSKANLIADQEKGEFCMLLASTHPFRKKILKAYADEIPNFTSENVLERLKEIYNKFDQEFQTEQEENEIPE